MIDLPIYYHVFDRDHEVFQNNSNTPQSPVEVQLELADRMGRFGNGDCLDDVVQHAGYSRVLLKHHD